MTTGGKHRVLVLGGGYAGLVAAARVAAGDSRTDVTLVDARESFVQRIRMHELLAGSEPAVLRYAGLLERRGGRFQQGWVDGLDTCAQWAELRTKDGHRLRLPYDTLVLALGSRTAAGVSGVARHALRLDDPTQVRAAAERLRTTGAAVRVVVVGGGLTGLETATELAERFPLARVAMLTNGRFGKSYSAAGEAHTRNRIAELGIQLFEGVHVESVEARRINLRGGDALPFDLCVWAGGFEAAPLAREAGLHVSSDGRAAVNATLQVTGHDNVFATGDSAAVRINGSVVRMGCVSAGPLGAHAGDNVLRQVRGAALSPFRFGFFIRCISLGRHDGLVQPTHSDDRPRERVVRRGVAARVKELVCRVTFLNVKLETAWGTRSSWWPKRRPAAIEESGAPMRDRQSA